MSASPKAHHLDDVCVPAPLSRATRSPLEIVAKPAKLDFAANPNHYRVAEKAGKSKPKRARGIDRSPRLLLECDTSQLLDPDFGE
ncbi:MAG: hypothetical protein LAO18_17015 [Acidobacteriia bacterium]|nr:hypothetical protein [Terriglobia bacterium]